MRALKLVSVVFDGVLVVCLSLVVLSAYLFPTVFLLYVILIGFVVALIGFAKYRLWKNRLFWLLFAAFLPINFLWVANPGPITQHLDTFAFLVTGFLASISAVLVWRIVRAISTEPRPP